MRPVFDGHNDALTRDEGADLTQRLDGGHLDLPRMREGGMRGGIFAVFTASAREDSHTPLGNLVPLAVDHETAAAHALAVADRLAGLERIGELTVAREIADV